jgi:hypothetical protein
LQGFDDVVVLWGRGVSMAKRRDILTFAGLAPAALLGAGKVTIPTVTYTEGQAKLTQEPFGELRIYFFKWKV